MGRVLAWQSDETGELFATQREYRLHLRKLARTRMVRRQLEEERRNFDEFVAPLRLLTNITAIEEWMVGNSERLMRAAAIENHRFWNRGGDPTDVIGAYGLTSFQLCDLRWSEKTSNTHHAPQGKKTNFGGYVDIPRGYPGWCGRVSYSLVEYFNFRTDFLATLGIHTGSGGGGRTMCRYEVFMFAEEWPNLFVTEKLNDRLKEGAILGRPE